MQKATTKRKRARHEDSPDSESEKRRGRPRVDKADVSNEGDPKDRRRLQIRMAQRAYRQRKESTLEELRKRVSDLSNTIELMNKAFAECRDRLYSSSSISVEQMRDLQILSGQFEGYLADARNPGEEDNVVQVEHAPEAVLKPSTPVQEQGEMVGHATNVAEWLDSAALIHAAKPRVAREADIGMGYEIDHVEQHNQPGPAQQPFILPKSDELVDFQAYSKGGDQFGTFDMGELDPFDATILRMTQPSPPTTYSFQESTLARRLFRASLEGAYHLLLDPSRRLVDYQRVFKLSLMGRTRATILRSLRRVLSKGIDDELDAWHAPLIHIGGSGTHYPRRDTRGNLLPRKQSTYIGLIGPQKLALLQDAARDKISVDLTVDIAGFEGEWFDPYDVQGYLEEKGIFIDPSQSFAEAELLEWSASSTSSSSHSASNQPPTPEHAPASVGTSVQLSNGHAHGFPLSTSEFTHWNDVVNMEMGSVGFSDAQMGSWMNFVPPEQGVKEFAANAPPMAWDSLITSSMQTAREQRVAHSHISPPASKSVVIDVTKFIEVLIVSGVCLGRSPGFRRRDVDRALAIASFDPS